MIDAGRSKSLFDRIIIIVSTVKNTAPRSTLVIQFQMTRRDGDWQSTQMMTMGSVLLSSPHNAICNKYMEVVTTQRL